MAPNASVRVRMVDLTSHVTPHVFLTPHVFRNRLVRQSSPCNAIGRSRIPLPRPNNLRHQPHPQRAKYASHGFHARLAIRAQCLVQTLASQASRLGDFARPGPSRPGSGPPIWTRTDALSTAEARSVRATNARPRHAMLSTKT